MTYAYELVTPAAEYAPTDAEMERHTRALGQPLEQYHPYVRAAQAFVEKITGRKLVSQTWKWFLDEWPIGDRLYLPFGKLSSVTHVKYTDIYGIQSTFGSDQWEISTARDPGVLALSYGKSWPSTTLRVLDPIEIQFVCGWTTAADVPEDLRAGILLMASHLYEHRESVIVGDSAAVESKLLEMGFFSLVANWRLYQ
jgi:uncharacterized phiE125 gp8 family phage protein